MPTNLDPMYMICVLLPAMLLSGLAQTWIRSAYSKWSQAQNSAGVTGADTGRTLMQNYNLNVDLQMVEQQLGDHFDPRNGIVRLSPQVAQQPSIASMAVAAHEFGHVQQHQSGNILMSLRQLIIPLVQLGSSFSYVLLLGGLMAGSTLVALGGLALFGIAVLFSVLTVPIELDASRRAMKMLDESGLIRSDEDRSGARAMLMAAGFTYIAAMITSLFNFFYYAMLIFGSSRRRRSA